MPRNKFFGHTVLLTDTFSLSVIKGLKKQSSGLKSVNLVDPEFKKMYDVFTNDQVEARYLIDPIMIERLKVLVDRHSSDGISVAYYQDKVLILLPSNKNFFEPANLYTNSFDQQSILRMKKELDGVFSLIDYLELYSAEEVHKEKVMPPS